MTRAFESSIDVIAAAFVFAVLMTGVLFALAVGYVAKQNAKQPVACIEVNEDAVLCGDKHCVATDSGFTCATDCELLGVCDRRKINLTFYEGKR